VALMDVSMQDLNGIEATAQIRAICPSTRVIMLSSHVDGAIVARALNAGASGYVIKGASPDELRAALKAAASGDVYLSPAVAKQLVPRLADRNAASPLDQLSARQREVLQLIAEGKRTKDIAKALDVSVKTVETHRIALMERLDIFDVPGLVMFALRHGLVNVDRY
jgi:DNA-binding NarL/FixJ family response regulator